MKELNEHIKHFLFFAFIALIGSVLTVVSVGWEGIVAGFFLLSIGAVAVLIEIVSFVRA